MSCPVIELAQQLIRRPSLSPDDAGCQALMIERLRANFFVNLIGNLERNNEPKGRALSDLAGNGDSAAHQFDKLFGDSKP